jgi:hypothetical protein
MGNNGMQGHCCNNVTQDHCHNTNQGHCWDNVYQGHCCNNALQQCTSELLKLRRNQLKQVTGLITGQCPLKARTGDQSHLWKVPQ